MSSTQIWTAEFLESKRLKADLLADDLVQSTLKSDGSANWEIVKLFSTMTRNDSPVPDELPSTLKAYFSNSTFPDWADEKKIALGQKLFGEYGIEIVMLLFCKSLPLAYSCALGSEVLIRTGRLTEKTMQQGEEFEVINRRVMETAQFVLNVMAPDGFDPNGRGIKTTQKIRLIHATIRHYLLENNWDTEKYGLPINQEDIAGTLMTFSYTVVDGLQQLGIELSEEESEAYIHCWNIVGYFLGIDQDLIPHNYASAKTLSEAILESQSKPSRAGQALAKSLLDYMTHLTPFGFAKHLPAMLVRELVGDEIANNLGIAAIPIWRMYWIRFLYRFFFRELGKLENSNKWICKLASRFSRSLLQFMTLMNNDFKAVRFYIPPSLKGNWPTSEN